MQIDSPDYLVAAACPVPPGNGALPLPPSCGRFPPSADGDMVFSSYLFLFFFLPLFLLSYFFTPRRAKNLVALLWSYLFYAWGAPRIFPLFVGSCLLDYILGRMIEVQERRPGNRRALLLLSLVFNLGALAYYKYSGFFVTQCNEALRLFGLSGLHWSAVALPVGISFFTFHKISYIVDVYRGTVRASRSFIDYSLYIALFPQLIAGPIIRYHDVNSQLTSRTHSLSDAFEGTCRFCIGLAKKVLIADAMGAVANHVFALSPDKLTTGYAWLGSVAYAYQIYFDFSGYSDMAIGLGRIMGFHFLENFDRPYISQNFTEFWRRWHISLSRWMRDYLYVPLGGNRGSPLRTYCNLWLVFLFSGLWHGANWTFVAWGLYHGFFLVCDKLFWLEYARRLSRVTTTMLTFLLVLCGWVLFRSDSFHEAWLHLSRMWNPFSQAAAPVYVPYGTIIHHRGIFILGLATLICFAPAFRCAETGLCWLRANATPSQRAIGRFVLALTCFLLSIIELSTTNYSPFIYYRF